MFKTFVEKIIKNRHVSDNSSHIRLNNQEKITANLQKNIKQFKQIYSFPQNSDVIIRHLKINGLQKNAAVLFIKTITDEKLIDLHILEPLLLNKNITKNIEGILPTQSVTVSSEIDIITSKINQGSVVLFVEGVKEAYTINVADFKERNIEKAENEIVIKGPKEAFNEGVSTNISLIRKKIKDENLIVESVEVTERSHNQVYFLYIKDLTNDKLVINIRNRLKALHVDSIQNLSMLEQYIEERPFSLFPSILYTERPDRAAMNIESGHIILLMDNSPSSLILPATFWSFFHTAEDEYSRFFQTNFTRLIRIFALFVTLFVSSFYIAVTEYHTEMIPHELLFAIAASREKVPFPPVVEILLMQLAFELIREAGLRVPAPIGPTIGIVGALILGQAAVDANIVSPVVVIVVALGGLSSFAIGDYSLNFALRVLKFVSIAASALFGIFGIVGMYTIGMFYLVSIKSFGVPYFAPLTPSYISSKDTYFKKLLRNELFRPGYLKPKDLTKK